MSVKSKPFFTDFRCTWLGSVAKPTYCLSISWRQGQDRSGACQGPWGSLMPYLLPSRGQSPPSSMFQWQELGEGPWAKVWWWEGRSEVAGEGTHAPASARSSAATRVCVEGDVRPEQVHVGPLLAGEQWAPDPLDTPKALHRLEKPQGLNTHPSRGWEAPSGPDPAAGVAGSSNEQEQRLFIDSCAESPRQPTPQPLPRGPPHSPAAL